MQQVIGTYLVWVMLVSLVKLHGQPVHTDFRPFVELTKSGITEHAIFSSAMPCALIGGSHYCQGAKVAQYKGSSKIRNLWRKVNEYIGFNAGLDSIYQESHNPDYFLIDDGTDDGLPENKEYPQPEYTWPQGQWELIKQVGKIKLYGRVR